MVWRAMAEQWVTELPHDYPFTADDLVLEVGLPTELDPKLSNNMVGSIMRHWRHTGQIVKTGYTMSDRRSNHGRVLATWEAYE